MKKLIMAAAIVCAAACAEAATAAWGSGAMYTAAGKDGGWSSTLITGNVVTMNLYLVDAETYATVSALDQKGIYSWASKQSESSMSANNNNGSAAAVTIRDTAAAGSTTFYSILTAEYTDATYGKMYMATATTLETPASGTKTVSNIFGGTAATHGVANWTAESVPEPTSGLLLLLGMGALALRRKQA